MLVLESEPGLAADRSVAGGSDERGRGRSHALDGLRAKAGLLDMDPGHEVLGHGDPSVTPTAAGDRDGRPTSGRQASYLKDSDTRAR